MILVLTSTALRHRFFALRLVEEFGARVVFEERPPRSGNQELSAFLRRHHAGFEETERRFFGERVAAGAALLDAAEAFRTDPKSVNEEATVARACALAPSLVLVHSTSLLKRTWLEAFPGRMLNLHAGLSPWYRGSATNLVPLAEGHPEHIGMTVHHMDARIDAGAILAQARPALSPSDDLHSIGCKNVLLGTELMIRASRSVLARPGLEGIPQNLQRGRLVLKKDVTEDLIRLAHENIASGLLERYCRAPLPVELVDVLGSDVSQ